MKINKIDPEKMDRQPLVILVGDDNDIKIMAETKLHLYILFKNLPLRMRRGMETMHPAEAREYALETAEWINSGDRVVVTTHSDVFMEQIANLVRMSSIPEKYKEKYADKPMLKESDVGVWLCTKGYPIKEIKIEKDSGVYPTKFTEVSESLYNEGIDIADKIENKVNI